MINIMQINVDGGRNAQDLLMATASERGADVLIVSEPYCCGTEDEGWFPDTSSRAAVFIANPKMRVREIGHRDNDGFRWVALDDIIIYSCYWSPNTDYTSFVDFLDRLEGSVRNAQGAVIVAGDFNAKSPVWGDHREDLKGQALADMMASMDMVACNKGDSPTFCQVYKGGISRSHIDITFVTGNEHLNVRNWEVLEDFTGSLHNYIVYNFSHTRRTEEHPTESRWSWRKYNKDKLVEYIDTRNMEEGTDPVTAYTALDSYLAGACDSCMPKGQYRRGKKPVYWWNSDIENLRNDCKKARRRSKRMRHKAGEVLEQCLSDFKNAKNALRKAIKNSKEACWSKLCDQVEKEPWGLPFKLVTKKLVGRRPIPGLSLPGRIEKIVNGLFPREPEIIWSPGESHDPFAEVTCQEIREICKKIPAGKAPGPDGVPDMIVKEVANRKPEILRSTVNSLLKTGLFPVPWKVANLVLLRKGNKPLENPSSYRPICLLNTVGKLLERIIKGRMESHLSDNDDLSDRQFGFRKGRSTVDAIQRVMDTVTRAGRGPLYNRKLCVVVALDVANAFNSARWGSIIAAVCEKQFPQYLVNILQSYLSNREIRYEGKTWRTTCGVPQGSVLGPLMWNLMYDGLLRIDTGGNVEGMSSTSLVAFADDVAVVATGHTTNILEEVTNNALAKIAEWMDNAGLKLAADKTEAVMLTTKRGYEKPVFSVKGVAVKPQEDLKYLGVQLSRKLGFKIHIETAAKKAGATAESLRKILPNVGGARQWKRKVVAMAVQSQLLYAAPVWADALEFESNVKTLVRPQRRMALRVAMAYRTVSTNAILVVAGMVPAHLKAQEQQFKFRALKQGIVVEDGNLRDMTFRKWQTQWNSTKTGLWTKRLISDIRKWTDRRFGETDFHLTQMLTGHGCFGYYLHKYKKRDDPACVDCGSPVDDVEHTIFKCDRWWRLRRELEVKIEAVMEPDTVISVMLRNVENWKAIKEYTGKVLSTKEEEERRVQRGRAADVIN